MPVEPVPHPAVFLDRDGTLIEEVNYCSRPEDVRIFADARAALLQLKEAGFLAIIITNQSGIGRGIFTLADYEKTHAELLRQLGPGLIDAAYFSPDHPDQPTERRKPGIGMIQDAVRDFPIDLTRSFLIGDKTLDIECGHRAGLRTILVQTGYGKSANCQPHFRARDLTEAVQWILQN